MKEFLKWIGKYKKLVIIIMLALVFTPIIAIQILFIFPAHSSWTDAVWEAGDILGYFGDVLSFIGTCALGAFSLYQNHVFKEANENAQKEQEKRYRDEKRPIYQFEYYIYDERNLVLIPKKHFNMLSYNERVIECKLVEGDSEYQLQVVDWNDSSQFDFVLPDEYEHDDSTHFIQLTISYTDIFNNTVHDTYWVVLGNTKLCSSFLQKREEDNES